jgi:hypothetical protein
MRPSDLRDTRHFTRPSLGSLILLPFNSIESEILPGEDELSPNSPAPIDSVLDEPGAFATGMGSTLFSEKTLPKTISGRM